MALGTTNITTTLVGNTIGMASNNVGALCSSSLINKWSKHKPVRYNTLSGLDDSDFQITNFGIKLGDHLYSTPIEAASISAVYEKPRGGEYNEPYRLGDFRKYDHYAIPPISGLIDLNIYSKYNTYFDIPYMVPTSDLYGTNISLEEFPLLSSMYLCVAIYSSSNSFICYKTTSSTLSNPSLGSIRFNLTDLGVYAGTAQVLKYFFCACVNKHDTVTDPYPSNQFRPLPFSSYMDATKNINIDTSFGLIVEPIGINKTISSSYEDINNFSDVNITPLYYHITSDGHLNIVYNFTPERDISIEMWKFSHYANHNFVDNNSTGDIPCNVYDISGASPLLLSGTYSMTQGVTYKLLFASPNFMRYSNGALLSNMVNGQKQIFVSLKYKNDLLWQVLGTYIQY